MKSKPRIQQDLKELLSSNNAALNIQQTFCFRFVQNHHHIKLWTRWWQESLFSIQDQEVVSLWIPAMAISQLSSVNGVQAW